MTEFQDLQDFLNTVFMPPSDLVVTPGGLNSFKVTSRLSQAGIPYLI